MKKYCLAIGLFLCGAIFLPAATSGYDAASSARGLLYPEYSKTISMDFKDAALKDVLKIFSQQSGLNFIASDTVADKKISLFLNAVHVEIALERILKANNLIYEIDSSGNVFIVKPISNGKADFI